MRSRLFTTAIVALTAVWLQGCDPTPTAPSASEPATNAVGSVSAASPGVGANAKPDNSLAYTFLHSGDVNGEAPAAGGTKKNDTSILANSITLDLRFFRDADFVTGGSTCFEDGSFTGPEQINEKAHGTDFALFFFDAKGTNGKPVHYSLHMLGDITGTWPPTSGKPGFFTAGPNPVGPEWEISARGKNRGHACTGSGSFTPATCYTDVGMCIEVTRDVQTGGGEL